MTYLYKLENTKNKAIKYIEVFAPLEIGIIIKWGLNEDKTTASWKVLEKI